MAVFGLLSACAETAETPREPESLVDMSAWEPNDSDADPLIAHRPATVECGPRGRALEGSALEIDTAFCNYASLTQEIGFEVRSGDGIEIWASHADLAAEEPAEAHMAVAVDGVVLWERAIPIPSPAQPYSVEIESPIDADPGAPIVFHLHNHGFNSWKLVDIRVNPGL